MCVSSNIRERFKTFKTAEADRGVSAEAVNQLILQGLTDCLEVSDSSRILELSDQLSIIPGLVAVLVTKPGRIYKAVSEDAAKEVEIKPSSWQVTAGGKNWYIYQELAPVASSKHGYHAPKMPYTGAFWQPYRHQLVAKAFGLLDEYPLSGDWVINHKGGKSLGDSLDNIEVVTHSENSLHGKFMEALMNDYPFIRRIYVSAKQADMLKKFYDPICGVLERKKDRDLGYVYKVKDVDIDNFGDVTVLKLKLSHGEYYQPLFIEVDTRGWLSYASVQAI